MARFMSGCGSVTRLSPISFSRGWFVGGKVTMVPNGRFSDKALLFATDGSASGAGETLICTVTLNEQGEKVFEFPLWVHQQILRDNELAEIN